MPEPARAERLVSEGVLGWARVESVHETGLADGDDAVLMLDLTVQVPGRERYRTSHTQGPGGFPQAIEASIRSPRYGPPSCA